MMADDVPEGDVDVDVEEKQREEVVRSADDKQVVVRLSHSVHSSPLHGQNTLLSQYTYTLHVYIIFAPSTQMIVLSGWG